jgi:hypothetical protein
MTRRVGEREEGKKGVQGEGGKERKKWVAPHSRGSWRKAVGT